MLVIMKRDATDSDVGAVVDEARKLGLTALHVPGSHYVVLTDGEHAISPDTSALESLSGVAKAVHVSSPFRLVSRETRPDDTIIELDGVQIGGTGIAVIAGPCAVESDRQLLTIAEQAAEAGAHLLRGGAYKPRTSPYSFQGLGEAGLRLLGEARRITGLPVVSEVVDDESVALAEKLVDVLQVGARNMQNYSLLRRVARTGKPILLKRGVAATLAEFLGAAEYILAEGNPHVILCERGVRGFSDYTRNTLDLSIVPAVKQISHLPIIVDPSHACGRRNMVIPLSRAAIAVGADGVMVEVHPDPARALSDGFQSLHPRELRDLLAQLGRLAPVVGRELRPRSRA